MKHTFETGGRYLQKIRVLMGCIAAPAFLGGVMLTYASADLGATLFSIAITSLCAAALYKAVTTRSDGTLMIDSRGIWLTQSSDPLGTNSARKINRTLIAWADIENIDIGKERLVSNEIAPTHMPTSRDKLLLRSRFMAHQSGDSWSIMIDHKQNRPCHLYASNMNVPRAAGIALGNALWSRGLIQIEEE